MTTRIFAELVIGFPDAHLDWLKRSGSLSPRDDVAAFMTVTEKAASNASVVYHNWLDISDFSCKIVADAKICQRGGPVRGRSKSIGELGESPIHSAAGGASLPHFVDGCQW